MTMLTKNPNIATFFNYGILPENNRIAQDRFSAGDSVAHSSCMNIMIIMNRIGECLSANTRCGVIVILATWNQPVFLFEEYD